MPASGAPETWPAVPAAGLPPDQVAVLFLSHHPEAANGPNALKCPVTPAFAEPTWIAGSTPPTNDATGRGQAFHIESDVPVTAYELLPFGGRNSYQSGAALLIPTSAWGTNFVTVVPLRTNEPFDPEDGEPGTQWAQVVAASDSTTVTLVSSKDLPGGVGVPATAKNTVATFKLSAGEYIQWQDTFDMSGSQIESDKPIAFMSGAISACLLATNASDPGSSDCSSMPQQIPPVKALGSEYAIAPYTSRVSGEAERVLYRVLGVVDGTTLTYDPPVAGAPASLVLGQVVDFDSELAFTVESQDEDHPFYIAQMMPGAPDGSAFGSAAFVGLVPPLQFLSRYVFFADPTYGTSDLVLVRVKDGAGFSDVSVDCAGAVSGWKPLGTSGRYEMTNFYLERDGKPNGACRAGRHVATSDGPFGVVVWGLDAQVGYAYAAGGNAASINEVVVKPKPIIR